MNTTTPVIASAGLNGFATLPIMSQKKRFDEPIAAMPIDSALYVVLHRKYVKCSCASDLPWCWCAMRS